MNEIDPQPVRLGPRSAKRVALSRTQSLIWTSQRLHPEVPLANMGYRFRISGALEVDRFVRSFDTVVRECEVLRMVIADVSGNAVARLADSPPMSTQVIEIAAADLDRWCEQRISRPIDATSCVYDSVLLRHGEDDWTWWLDIHHVATDAHGSALVFEATAAAYEHDEGAGGAALDLGVVVDGAYFDHVARTAERASSARARDTIEERADAWAAELSAAGPQPPLEPYGRRGGRTTVVNRVAVPLSSATSARLDEALDSDFRTLSRELGVLAISASAAALTVHRLDGREHIVVGVPVHHRSLHESSRVVGPLMELYPLTVAVDTADTHRTMFTRVLRSIMELLRRAKPGESPDAAFEVVLNVFTARYGTFAGLPTRTEWIRSGHVDPNHSIRCHVFDDSDGGSPTGPMEWELDVNEALSADGSAERFPSHFAAVVSAMVAGPDAGVGDAPIVDAVERAELALLDPDARARHHDTTVHEQIRRMLQAEPNWLVAEHDDVTVSAAHFDRQADRLAAWLRAAGLERGRAVGVRMPRSIDVLIAIHGVLRAGGVFVPMAVDDPPARSELIAADAELLMILDALPDDEELDSAGRQASGVVELPAAGLDDGAYILYTSGSTGEPKGVPISHRGLADYLDFAVNAYCEPFDDDSPPFVALHSSLVFDLTVTSLFLSFLTGGRLVIFDEEPIDALGRIALDDRINFLKATPSQLELFTRVVRSPRPLRTVVVGGEAFRRPVAERLAASCVGGVRIFNEYGPTEAVVGCMVHEWDPELDVGSDVPIGHAAPGSQIVVLDRFGQLSPSGAWGELHVRRPGMAQQYLHRADLTLESFVDLDRLDVGFDRLEIAPDGEHDDQHGDDPGAASISSRWYRTGDRVRVERPGVATYGGRMDDQVKVNGMRLEPAEVEGVLVDHPAVKTALVRVWTPSDALTVVADDQRCARCGLGLDVPGIALDGGLICSVCHSFDVVKPQTERWFRTEADLDDRLHEARARRSGNIDCLHLLSGGKDSTYALYQLVARGWNVHTLTLDNGYISEGAKHNVRRSVADLGISHEFATTSSMNEIFRDSLERYSNVCQGCYKTIYTLAVARAAEMGIPVVVTGLSRGQFFETRLVPHQFERGRFDSDEIDRTVLEARRVYHQTADAVTELLPEQRVFDDDSIFDDVQFMDFYRYVDVDLGEMYRFLEERAPWVRPADTGRSTNCLINVAGIHVHRLERGYHNYAEPYSWDVRLGHKTREEALDELDDDIDDAEVARLLEEVGYTPKTNAVLTAWYQSVDGVDIDPDELRGACA